MMPVLPLHGTSRAISRIGFGCWAIGKQYWGDDVDDATSAAAIERALELGVNWFDTAPLYGMGHADTVLTETLGARRHDVTIATKVGIRMSATTGHAMSDLSASHVVADCEASLRRLKLDRIPLLQVHWPCEVDTPLAETVDALEGLRTSGRIEAWGVCNYGAPAMQELLRLGAPSTLQTPLSMVRREYEHGLAQVCASDGAAPRVSVLAYETLCRGLLTGKHGATPPTFPSTDMRSHDDRFRGAGFARAYQLNRAVGAIAAKLGVPPAAVAVAWALRRPGVTAAIVGAKRADQIEASTRAVEIVDRAGAFAALQPFVDRTRM